MSDEVLSELSAAGAKRTLPVKTVDFESDTSPLSASPLEAAGSNCILAKLSPADISHKLFGEVLRKW